MLKEKLKLVPNKPGCYLMKNKNGIVIYVGKAKKLKNRLASYFRGKHIGKTGMLVREISDFEYIITNSETEAFVLELNLIKEHNPKYNIMYRDDKTYPYIMITDEKYPMLKVVRVLDKKSAKGELFGPYPNVTAARDTVNLLNNIFPLRKCKNIPKKPCLYYHLGLCLGHCIENVNKKTIEKVVTEVRTFLNGNTTKVVKELEKKMDEASHALNFEKAREYRDLISQINQITEEQKVETKDNKNRDVFGYFEKDGWLSIQVFHIRGGKLLTRHYEIVPILDEVSNELLKYIGTFYENNLIPEEIIVPDIVDLNILKDTISKNIISPVKGVKRKLLDLATENAKELLKEKLALLTRSEKRTEGAIIELGEILDIKTPYRIEAFDNSNILGTNPVSSMVVFINGRQAKREYRKYKIKTVSQSDDYHSMEEVLYRRYFRILKENLERPDLIIVDGGCQQLRAALNVLTSLNMDIPVIALKKDEKHKTSEVIYGKTFKNVKIDPKSNAFYLLTRIQEETHRFAINYHRLLRKKGQTESILDKIKGIGPTHRKKLLKHFGSLENIKKATLEELTKIIPKEVALNLQKIINK